MASRRLDALAFPREREAMRVQDGKDVPSAIMPAHIRKKRKMTRARAIPFLTVLPSIVAIGVFVYGFIGWSAFVSMTKWRTLKPDYSFAGLQNYAYLFQDYRFQSDLRNILMFTILFILACIVIGMILAIMVDQRIRAESFFRSAFIFPMSLSFIVTGVSWQWILNPSSGVNLILRALGVHHPPNWYIDTTIVPSFNVGQIQFGLPLALISVVIAAVWQMSGFAMALYLAGLRAIPEEIKEAARVDGATSTQTFFRVILPQLRPVTVTVVIILSYISMRIFDLVYAMTGPGALFVTDMPSMDMFTLTFQANQVAEGAAISIIMVLGIAVFVVPYLIASLRREVQS